jgi:glucose-1-phosphate thymidylyltransferase
MLGIVPAAGAGSRIQPLAFSKELLPVGSRLEGDAERPRAVSEYLVERMVLGGADRICFVIAPGKSDILEYYGNRSTPAHICYTVRPSSSLSAYPIRSGFRKMPSAPWATTRCRFSSFR